LDILLDRVDRWLLTLVIRASFVANDLVEFGTTDDQEYEEIVEEYEQEIFVLEEF
jgi:hypothetical protein